EILSAEAEGVLAWIARGAIEWYKQGLDPPDDVVKAGDEYRSREDVVAEYMDERVEYDSNAVTTKKELYNDYCEWAKPDKPMSSKAFAERIAQLSGIEPGWKGNAKAWKHVRIAPTDQPIA